MSEDLVDLKLEKLPGEVENGTRTLKTDPSAKQRSDRNSNTASITTIPLVVHLALYELREPQLTNDQTQTRTQIGMVESTSMYKLREPGRKLHQLNTGS